MKYSYLFSVLILASFLGCSQNETKHVNMHEDITETTNFARTGTKERMSGAYLNYTNTLNIADTLLSVSSPVAESIEIHESYSTEDGLSGMRALDEISLKPNETLEMQAGGIHMMLINLKQNLTTHDSVQIQLELKHAGTIARTLPVRN